MSKAFHSHILIESFANQSMVSDSFFFQLDVKIYWYTYYCIENSINFNVANSALNFA